MLTKVALMLGTFNPIHWGHLLMADLAQQQFSLEKVFFIPSANPPHRSNELDLVAFEHRLAMVTRAIEPFQHFEVRDMEGKRSGPSYTVDTLVEIAEAENILPGEKIPVIIGSDALSQLASWHKPAEVIDRAVFLQVPRIDTPWVESIQLAPGVVKPLATRKVFMPLVGMSSTWIRQSAQSGILPQAAMPEAVWQYIQQYQLWQEAVLTKI
ncbi:MAG: nicotinate (nicotinamide) nucleotide adenylyltransferase [Cyanobacteria bacterium]|nr:nicotinate (nicotinamide) nucleotide adenylyltransferase [Cyanobacteriota bacterium]